MKIFRCEIHGHRIEFRLGDWGGEQVLVDGRVVSSRSFWTARRSHFFDITDERGKARYVEVRRFDASKLGLGKYRAIVQVDGVERARLEPIDLTRPPDTCPNCGYSLAGLPAENSEIRCPECGRHSSAILRS